MKQLRNRGLSYASIAKLFNLSRQRVHQLISGYSSEKNETKKNKILRDYIFKRDDYKCQWGEVCKGEDVYRKDLIVHHIDFDNGNNKPSNLIILCSRCHLKFHSQNHIDPEVEKRLLKNKFKKGNKSTLGKHWKLSKETKEKMKGHIPWNKGTKLSKDIKRKMKQAKSGENNPNWKGGISRETY